MTPPGETKENVKAGEEKAPETKDVQTPDLNSIGNEATELSTKEEKQNFVVYLGDNLAESKKDLSKDLQKKLWPPDGNGDFNAGTALAYYGDTPKQAYTKAGVIDKEGQFIASLEEDEETDDDLNSTLIPERRAGGKGGKELFREWGLERDANVKQEELTRKIIAEIRKGNVPDMCRTMRTTTLRGEDGTEISFATANDYLAVGTNNDYMTIPVSGYMARRLSDEFGWELPTSTMAIASENSATHKIVVGGEKDISEMAELKVCQRHNERIQSVKDSIYAKYAKKAKSMKIQPMTQSEYFRKYSVSGGKKVVFAGRDATPEGKGNGGIGIVGLREAGGGFTQPPSYPHKSPLLPGSHNDYSEAGLVVGKMVRTPEGIMPLREALKIPQYARILNAQEAKKHRHNGTYNASLAYLPPKARGRITRSRKASRRLPTA